MKDPEIDRILHRQLADSAPADVQRRSERQFAALRDRLGSGPTEPRSRSPLVWLWAGMGFAGSFAVAVIAAVLFLSPAPSWAQVAERFRQVGFFNATVFFTASAEEAPEKIELWVAQDHQLRAHYRGLLFFGSDGKLSKVLSSETGEEIPLETLRMRLSGRQGGALDPYPALSLVRGIARLGEMPEFSLDHLLQLFRSKRESLQPAANTQDRLARDVEVFDFTSPHTPEWTRLWVLKKSQLPARLRVWNPAGGGQTEMLFDYATQMPADAFDGAKVQASIREKQGSANRLYSLLRDSGGRPLTPEQLFASRGGYRLPEIDSVGRTPEGVVWVLSRKVENYREDGRQAFGWERLVDDLGQTYTHRTIGWMAEDDALLEYFVPANLDAGFKLPGSYTLVCTDRPRDETAGASGRVQEIGSRAIASWRETASVPDLLKAQQNQVGGRTNWQLLALDESAEQQDWTRFDQLVAAIPGAPENDATALARDVKVVHKLVATRQREAAAVLCARLYPLVTDSVRAGDRVKSNVVRWYIAELFRGGRREVARKLANRHAVEALQHSKIEGPQFIVDLLLELRLAGLKESDVSGFFDATVVDIPAPPNVLEQRAPFPGAAPLSPRVINVDVRS